MIFAADEFTGLAPQAASICKAFMTKQVDCRAMPDYHSQVIVLRASGGIDAFEMQYEDTGRNRSRRLRRDQSL
jgi:hypothetical protein